MSWLYEHRDQLDGLGRFAEIAYRATFELPPCDQDDVEQDIIIALLDVLKRRGDMGKAYSRGIARVQVKHYWRKKCREQRKFWHPEEWQCFTSNDGDNDARLDAVAELAVMPERLVQIGHKRLSGESLNGTDKYYWQRHKAKLDCRKRGRKLSDEEKERIVRLYRQGRSLCQIARATGRSISAVCLHLAQTGLREPFPCMTKRQVHRYNLEQAKESERVSDDSHNDG